MRPQLTLSVHQLVDFLLRTGDIDNRIFNKASMAEGTRIHAYYQKKQGNHYLSEYALQETFEVDDFIVTLEGRADGIILLPHRVIIDEIKSTVIDLDAFAASQKTWHLGQAECYALMYAHEQNLTQIDIRLTYISQVTDTQKVEEYHYDVSQLEKRIDALLRDYLDFHRILYRKKEERNRSCQSLSFPFPSFREGQRELTKYCYAVAKKGGRLFVEAPTGIGKTISTLYPAVRSFADESNDKIFYLTAKTSGRVAAFQAVKLLKDHGLQCTVITISAKEKICFQHGASCNPDECPFAQGYYQKLQSVLRESLACYDTFHEQQIIDIAAHYEMCPFELELDLSLYADIILCDYNYVFDPMVYMRRYFDEDASHYMALIDEAHNLVERGRDMFSTRISYSLFLHAKKALGKIEHKKMKNACRRMNKWWKELRENYPLHETVIPDVEDTWLRIFDQFVKAGQDFLKNEAQHVDDDFLTYYFSIHRFLKLYECLDDSFCLYVDHAQEKEISLALFCMDPSRQLRKRLNQLHATVFFSATLSPADYYMRVLGGDKEDPLLMLPSPFPRENLLLMVQPNISTRLKNREETMHEIAQSIRTFVKNKIGNYFIFFPSYAYLEAVKKQLEAELPIIAQTKEMMEKEKEAFLSHFPLHPQQTTIGFVVLGGAFSEGIDLMDDRLIGAMIVGVGLPTISFERNLIRDYYQKNDENGYHFSYVNPGMNRVMQAVGRVIRSEQDRGMILLVDDRFLHRNYQELFKNEWRHYEVVTEAEEIANLTNQFWQK